MCIRDSHEHASANTRSHCDQAPTVRMLVEMSIRLMPKMRHREPITQFLHRFSHSRFGFDYRLFYFFARTLVFLRFHLCGCVDVTFGCFDPLQCVDGALWSERLFLQCLK